MTDHPALTWYGAQLDADQKVIRATDEDDWMPAGGLSIFGEDRYGVLCVTSGRAARQVVAMRRRLGRHQPRVLHPMAPGWRVCHQDNELWPCQEIRDDMAVYSDRDGYQEEWRP